MHTTDCAILSVIGRSLHKLKELYLDRLEDDDYDAVECLVAGCPLLRIIHIQLGHTLDSVQCILAGLPELMEFKHPLMVYGLEKIIGDDKADKVSAIRNLFIHDESFSEFDVTDVVKSAQTVMNHLNNITKLDITVPFKYYKESLTTFSLTLSTMSQLTELTWREEFCKDTIVPIIELLGHQLKVLNLSGMSLIWLDVIARCRKLRVLSLSDIRALTSDTDELSYDLDVEENFTPFQYLQNLSLYGVNRSHFKATLFKSLVASPVLQHLTLQWVPIFTDDIVKTVFSHVNQEGEQLTFTSLRKLELDGCESITNYLLNIVTHDRVPLELLTIEGCSNLTERHLWNLQPFDMEFSDFGYDYDYIYQDTDDDEDD